MEDQEYCLRWNSHQPNFISVFKSLLELEELVDVTLSVEGKQIKAHKVILSACSPYLKLLFTTTPSKHPIVILDDIKYRDLKSIVDFAYCGEINVPDKQLADILDLAEALQIRGLYDPNKKTEGSTSNCSTPKKKRKTKPDVSQSSAADQSLCEGDSVHTESDRFLDPTEWLEIESNVSNKQNGYKQNNLPTNIEEILNGSGEQEVGNGLILRQSSGSTQDITKPGRPSGRRNSKVQESENFLQALDAVRSGSLGFCKAAKLFGLNNRTLWLEYKRRGYPALRPPVNAKHRQSTSTTS